MATALLKNSLLRAHCDRHFTYFAWKRSFKYTISGQAASPSNTANRLHRLRLKHSDFPKPKHMEFPSPNTISSRFSSTTSSSSQKFRLVRWYLNSLNNRPIATKSITAALIYTVADLTSQTTVGWMEQYELMRTLRMAGYGFLILGPSLHYWYNFMSRFFPKRDLLSTFKKMALGQTFYGPAMTVVFFSVNAALQGESGSEIVARLKRDLIPTMINGILYWPVCDFVTFKFIPVHLQARLFTALPPFMNDTVKNV
ncbi:hypothetical protein ACS0TY_002722 [Phlomoides rotata]